MKADMVKRGQMLSVDDVKGMLERKDKLKKGEPPASPDKMTKVQVAADAK